MLYVVFSPVTFWPTPSSYKTGKAGFKTTFLFLLLLFLFLLPHAVMGYYTMPSHWNAIRLSSDGLSVGIPRGFCSFALDIGLI